MVITKKYIPRRTFLRGVGAAVALPMLDAMTPAFAVEAKRPIRMMFMQVPNGIMNLKNEFAPKDEGPITNMPRTLEPMAAFKDNLVIPTNLDQNQAGGLDFEIAGDHPRAATAWLTGAHAKMTSGADLKGGISADQIAARQFGKETQLASLEIGLESPEVIGSCEAAYACAYYNTISWRNDTSPLPMENRPRALFERLFGETTDPEIRMALRKEDRSIIDTINASIKKMRLELGGTDRSKIDQYIDAIRDVERRMQLAEKQSGQDLPLVQSPVGAPEVFSDYFKLMTDLLVLSWQTDMTRVITFMMGHEMSGRAYPEIGFPDAHHPCTHHQGDPEKIEKTTKINTFHVKQLAYFCDRLANTKDGDGSLLDNSMTLYGAALSDANLHLYTDLPLLLTAGKNTGIKGGVMVKYPKRTPMTNLLVTMLDKAGVTGVESLGDSKGRVALPSFS